MDSQFLSRTTIESRLPHRGWCLLAFVALVFSPVSALAQSSESEEGAEEELAVEEAAEKEADGEDLGTLVYEEEKAEGLIEKVGVFVSHPVPQRALVVVVVALRDTVEQVDVEVHLNPTLGPWQRVPPLEVVEGSHQVGVTDVHVGKGLFYVLAVGADGRVLDNLGHSRSPRSADLRSDGGRTTTQGGAGAEGEPATPDSSFELAEQRRKELQVLRTGDEIGWVVFGAIATASVAAQAIGGAYAESARLDPWDNWSARTESLYSASQVLDVIDLGLGTTGMVLSYIIPSMWRWRAYPEAASDARQGRDFDDALLLRGLRWKARGQVFGGMVGLGLAAGHMAAYGIESRLETFRLSHLVFLGGGLIQGHVVLFSAMANFIRADRMERELGWSKGVARTRAVQRPTIDLVPYLVPAAGSGGVLAVGRF